MALHPLTWNKVRAGEYRAFDRQGNTFLIRHEFPRGGDVWTVFVNDRRQGPNRTLASAKRYVEGIARKHSTALKASI